MSLDVSLHNPETGEEIYWANITHNLTKMASEAGLYDALWHPENLDALTAKDLIAPISNGLHELLTYREKFEAFNPENGWGDYESFAKFTFEYLLACTDSPEAVLETSV